MPSHEEDGSPRSIEIRLGSFCAKPDTLLLLDYRKTSHLSYTLQDSIIQLDDPAKTLDGFLDSCFTPESLEHRGIDWKRSRRGGQGVDKKQITSDPMGEKEVDNILMCERKGL